jgi:Raf kinase inhibitor-like YbhB/YbcL family protein
MSLELKSPAFHAAGAIPRRHAKEGADLSPPLSWTGAPRQTRSLALMVEDPDVPGAGWVHWLVWNLPSECQELAEGVRAAAFTQGRNGYGQVGWGGPNPPMGEGAHRYVFRLFALDDLVDLQPGAGRDALEGCMHGHVLAQASLTGKYWRSG